MKQYLNIVLAGRLVDVSSPVVMAVINVTPDSFFADSRICGEKSLANAVCMAVADGATILDVGGCSTRPGALSPSVDEEWQRVSWALRIIREQFPDVPVSIDTFRAVVAQRAVEEFGVAMVNDVSGGAWDAAMFRTMAHLQVPYVLTHVRGTPQTMRQMTDYEDFIPDILRYFAQKTEQLRQCGFDKEIVIDPGFGFAKTTPQNLTLLRHLPLFQTYGMPVMVGLSRKTMLCETLGVTPDKALNGTTAANMLALCGGANLLRVHDVRAAVEAVRIYKAMQNAPI